MFGVIDNKNFVEMEPMKYWAFPSTTTPEVRKNTVINAIYSGDYMGARKVDGYYQRIVKDEEGNCAMIARSRNVKGEVVNKIEWLPHINRWLESLPNGTVLLCECYIPGAEGSKNITSILGCLKEKAITRQKEKKLHLYVFDCIAYAGESLMTTKYESRAEYVRKLSEECPSEYVEYAEYYEGEELWDMLQEYLAAGYEGMVIMRKDAIVYEKRTPARISIKIKQELKQTIDCVVIGANPPTKEYGGKMLDTWIYWVNAVTDERLEPKERLNEYMRSELITPVTKGYYYNFAGSLRLGLVKNGKIEYFGDLSGLTEEVLKNWRDYLGQVCEVTGMSIDKESGHIRHPKFVGWRTDKKPEECEWSQVE